MARPDVSLSKVVAAITECVCVALAKQGGGPTCWCGLFPGTEVSWDYCGECSSGACGMGYVRLISVYESQQFPQQDPLPSNCGAPLVAELAVGALRCIPVADRDGSLPDEAALLEAGLATFADMAAIRSAVQCCDLGDREFALGTYLPLGARGGCVGGEWTVWVAL
jgi:hypothetical protein